MRYIKFMKMLIIMTLLISFSHAADPNFEILLDSNDFGTNWGLQPTWGGGIGFWFTTGDTVRTVHKLGFIDVQNVTNGDKTPDGLVRSHTIFLYDTGDLSAPIGQVTVPAGTAGQLIDGFRYADLVPPVTLQTNTEYLVLGSPGEATTNGDRYINPNTLIPNPHFVPDINDPNNWARGHFNPWDDPVNGQKSYVVGQAYGAVNLLADIYSAHEPDPANGAEYVGVPSGGNIDVTLQWKTGLDPCDINNPNPLITSHMLYYGPNDPNLEKGTVVSVNVPSGYPTVGTDASYLATGLDYDQLYHWRVDEVLVGDPCNLKGSTWSFTTLAQLPVIIDQPDDVLAVESDTVLFDISVSSVSPETYTWYKSADSQIGGDTQVGIDANTLTIINANINDDEAFYYCKVTSTAGTIYSDVVGLWFEREIARWRMNDNLNDSSGLGFNGVWDDFGSPNVPAQTFDTNAVEGTHSISLHADPNAFVSIPGSNDFFNHHVVGLTASVWVRTDEDYGWQTFVAKSDASVAFADGDTYRGWLLSRNYFGFANMSVRGVGAVNADVDIADRIDDGNWHMVTGVYEPEEAGDGGTIKVYLDGLLANSEYFATAVPTKSVADVSIGVDDTYDLTYSYPYEGQLDDIRIFTYPMTSAEVADLYLEHITDASICIDGDYPEFDFNGDCKVDFEDLDDFASGWLECNLYPASKCND